MGLLAQREPRLRGRALVEVRHATRILVGARERFEREGDFARELLERHDPERVLAYWVYERVVVLAVEAAAEVGLTHPLWEDAAEQTRAVARASALRHDLTTRAVTRLLDREGIPAVTIKGPAMARELYESAERRWPSTDVDVLVPVRQLTDAVHCLQSHGWGPPSDARVLGELPDLHFALPSPDDRSHVELHWRLGWFDDASFAAEVLDEAHEAGGIRLPSARHTEAVTLIAWGRGGFGPQRLLADWVRAHDLARHAAPLPASHATRLLSGLRAAAAETAGQTVSEPFQTARAYRRLAAHHRPTAPRARASQVALTDLLMAPKGRRLERFRVSWAHHPSVIREFHPWARFPGMTSLVQVAGITRSLCRAPWHHLLRHPKAAVPRGRST